MATATPPFPSPTISQPSLDLTALIGDDDTFESEAAWLNDILASNTDSEEDPFALATLDQRLARTLGLLEVATHDTSSLVDRTIEIGRAHV